MSAAVVGAAVGVFLATNVDTFVVVAALFATHPTASATIAGGQFLGFAAVVAVAVAIAAGLDHLESRWFALFGIWPLAAGGRGLWRLARRSHPEDRSTSVKVSRGSAALMIMGTGGDNVAVYVPVFHALGAPATMGVIAVFVVLDLAMCAAAFGLGNRRLAVAAVERGGRIAVPLIYTAIGIGVLLQL